MGVIYRHHDRSAASADEISADVKPVSGSLEIFIHDRHAVFIVSDAAFFKKINRARAADRLYHAVKHELGAIIKFHQHLAVFILKSLYIDA